MPLVEFTESVVVRGYGQYNPGDKATFSEGEVASLLSEFPSGWRACQREDAKRKALEAPPTNKMVKAPEHKK